MLNESELSKYKTVVSFKCRLKSPLIDLWVFILEWVNYSVHQHIWYIKLIRAVWISDLTITSLWSNSQLHSVRRLNLLCFSIMYRLKFKKCYTHSVVIHFWYYEQELNLTVESSFHWHMGDPRNTIASVSNDRYSCFLCWWVIENQKALGSYFFLTLDSSSVRSSYNNYTTKLIGYKFVYLASICTLHMRADDIGSCPI